MLRRIVFAAAIALSFGQSFAQGLPVLHGIGVSRGPAVGGWVSLGPAASGQLPIAQGASADPVFHAISGDCSLVSSGALTCLTLNGTPIGTSGATIPVLSGNNTWSGTQSFNNGDLILNGSGSGQTIVKAPAAGGVAATFFSGTDTVLGAIATQTVQNKTINTSNISGAFYLDCPGTTDETATIASLISGLPAGSTIVLPADNLCTVSSGFTITKSFAIVGSGPGSGFTGTLGGGVNLFLVQIPANTIIRGMKFENFKISIAGGSSLFYFLPNATVSNLAELSVSNINGLGSTTLTGDTVVVDNPLANTNGGVFDATFSQDQFITTAGHFAYTLSNAGDTIRINGGLLTGAGTAMLVTQIGGAGNFVLSGGTNITTAGGIIVDCAVAPIIRDFEMEATQAAPVGLTKYLDLRGGSCTVSYPTIGPGQLQILPGGTGFTAGLNIGTADHASFDNIRMTNTSVSVPAAGINVAAASTNAVRGPNIVPTGFTAAMVDAGTGTLHVTTAAGP